MLQRRIFDIEIRADLVTLPIKAHAGRARHCADGADLAPFGLKRFGQSMNQRFGDRKIRDLQLTTIGGRGTHAVNFQRAATECFAKVCRGIADGDLIALNGKVRGEVRDRFGKPRIRTLTGRHAAIEFKGKRFVAMWLPDAITKTHPRLIAGVQRNRMINQRAETRDRSRSDFKVRHTATHRPCAVPRANQTADVPRSQNELR